MKSSAILLASLCLAAASFAQIADQATPVSAIKMAKGFKAELLYSVPKADQGSWVSMTQDDKGRIACPPAPR